MAAISPPLDSWASPPIPLPIEMVLNGAKRNTALRPAVMLTAIGIGNAGDSLIVKFGVIPEQ